MTYIDEFWRSHLQDTGATFQHTKNSVFHVQTLQLVRTFAIGTFASTSALAWTFHVQPNSINMGVRSVCFPSVCALVCLNSFWVSYMSRFHRRSQAASHSWEDPRPAHVGRERGVMLTTVALQARTNVIALQGANLCRI